MINNKELFLIMFNNWNIEFLAQDYEEDKKIHLFNDKQLKEILRLSIELGIYSYFI